MSSILRDCRIGDKNDTYFDDQLVMYINTIFSQLYRMGVGPEKPFEITGDTEFWEDWDADPRLFAVRTYVTNKVLLAFDPPANGTVVESIKSVIDEAEFTLRCNTREIRKEKLDE